MNRIPGQGYPGSDFTPSLAFVPALGLSRLATSPNSVQFLWYRAFPDLSLPLDSRAPNGLGAGAGGGAGPWTRVLQPGTFWGLLDTDERTVKRYLPSGTFEAGTVSLAFDPALSPLSQYDWIVPLGLDGGFSRPQPGLAPCGRTLSFKEVVVRGAAREAGAGTVSTVGTAVSGQGADFAAFFAPGDLFCAADFTARVLAVTSSAALTLDAAPPVDFTAIGYTRGADPLSYPPVAAVGDVRSASRAFVFGVDFAVRSLFPGSLSGDGLLWLPGGNSPAPGEPYSVLYDYLPRYELTDYGQKAPVVGGQRLLSTAAASLWKPQTHPDL